MKMSNLLIASLLFFLTFDTSLEARRYRSRVYIGVESEVSEPVYVRRVAAPYEGCRYRSCRRAYTRGVPPVYAYPHTVYAGPPGVVYEEIYPAPPYCDCCEQGCINSSVSWEYYRYR